jgi:hypothetical protein
MFRVRDLDNGDWVVKGNGGELSPTQHKNVATIFEGDAWLGYWQEKEGVEIIPLTETEIMERLAQTGLTFDSEPKYNIRESGGLWVTSVIDKTTYFSARQSEAKVFTEADLEAWRGKPGYEIVEIPNPFGIKGEVKVLKLPGFE